MAEDKNNTTTKGWQDKAARKEYMDSRYLGYDRHGHGTGTRGLTSEQKQYISQRKKESQMSGFKTMLDIAMLSMGIADFSSKMGELGFGEALKQTVRLPGMQDTDKALDMFTKAPQKKGFGSFMRNVTGMDFRPVAKKLNLNPEVLKAATGNPAFTKEILDLFTDEEFARLESSGLLDDLKHSIDQNL